jgi:hypothetical protein
MPFVALYCLFGLRTAEGAHDANARFSIVHFLLAGSVVAILALIWALLVWEDRRAWAREEARTRQP